VCLFVVPEGGMEGGREGWREGGMEGGSRRRPGAKVKIMFL
jgi:hypothetical protein